MAKAPQGYLDFPGISQTVSASMVLSHGITPSVCTIEIAPQVALPKQLGDLVWTFGATRIIFRDCLLNSASLRTNSSNQIMSLSVWDRRWRWRYGTISGSYNIQVTDGLAQKVRAVPNLNAPLLFHDPANLRELQPLDRNQVRTARQLCALCLDAMGERHYDVSQVSNDLCPEVNWVNENPANALADIAEQAGCRVVLRLDNTVMVAKTGVGAFLPVTRNPGPVDGNVSLVAPNRPDSITVVCGPTMFEDEFELEPVGVDTDGDIKHINDLSYRRQVAGAGGWATQVPGVFGGVPLQGVNGTRPRELAQRYVYKWYRIKNEETNLNPIAGYHLAPVTGVPGPRIEHLHQILPLSDELSQLIVQDGRLTPKRAYVFGSWFDPAQRQGGFPQAALGANPLNRNVAFPSFYTDPYTFLPDLGIVVFEKYVYKKTANWSNEPAKMFLVCAFHIEETGTLAHHRYSKTLQLPGPRLGTGTRIIRKDDITLRCYPQIGKNGLRTGKVISNKADIDPELDHILQAAAAEYQITAPQDITYPGLWAIQPDGAIQQIAWRVGLSGATTRASRNTEFSVTVPKYKQRRLLANMVAGNERPRQPPKKLFNWQGVRIQ